MSNDYFNNEESNKNLKKILFIFLIAFILFFAIFIIREITEPLYIVVAINPAHGGKYAKASKTDGDRYDEKNAIFTVDYVEGIKNRDNDEYSLLLDLSKDIYNILDTTKNRRGWMGFANILKKYSHQKKLERVIFEPILTKETNYNYYEAKGEEDVNKYFRIMDSPAKTIFKKRNRGILSFLFKYKPNIILNFDLNYKGLDDDSIFTINVPSYKFFNFIKERIVRKDTELKNIENKEFQYIIRNWFGKTEKEKKDNLLKDMWLYFTGYYPDDTYLKAQTNRFMGRAYNMIDWDYRDSSAWYEDYVNKNKYSQYNIDLNLWKPAGYFWERENREVELRRRKDNFFAGNEFVRYIKYVLKKNGFKVKTKNPIFDYNEMTLFTTGITVDINLGSIYSDKSVRLLKEKRDALVEAICVSLYSVVYGLKIDDGNNAEQPQAEQPQAGQPRAGHPIDFKYYEKEKYNGIKNRR